MLLLIHYQPYIDTRTSRNAWVGRRDNYITETLFRRAEHLLKVPRLDHINTEDMQVVHYTVGQKYDNHHDWVRREE